MEWNHLRDPGERARSGESRVLAPLGKPAPAADGAGADQADGLSLSVATHDAGPFGGASQLRDLLDRAQSGAGGVLVLRGDAGIGKTALLDDAADAARDRGMPVVFACGVEAESVIPYAALSELLSPLLGRIGEIPGPQAASMEAALAIRGYKGAERFAVAAATLSLLAAGAEERGLLVCLDDAQWTDPASTARCCSPHAE